jgi:hypothetical protein
LQLASQYHIRDIPKHLSTKSLMARAQGGELMQAATVNPKPAAIAIKTATGIAMASPLLSRKLIGELIT